MAGFVDLRHGRHGLGVPVGLPISALWAIAAPSTQSLITRQVGAEVQGRIQGALMSLVSLAGVIGPVLFAGRFGYFVDDRSPVHISGAPWFIAATLLACAVVIAWRFARAPAAQSAVANAQTS